jgi:hypothetical protein
VDINTNLDQEVLHFGGPTDREAFVHYFLAAAVCEPLQSH